MVWLFMVGALALEPTSADALMPVYIARLEQAAAEETQRQARADLATLKKRRGVVAQKMKTAKKLLVAAGEGGESAEAATRMEEAAQASAALEEDIDALEDTLTILQADVHMWETVRHHEVARSALAHTEQPPEKIGGLQRAVERAASKRADATAAAVSAHATLE